MLDLEEKVSAAIARLKERGLTSPYLRSFVVSRINPLRWIQGELPPAEKVITQMRDRAAKFNVGGREAGGPRAHGRRRPRRRGLSRYQARWMVRCVTSPGRTVKP